ncbi:hypothetical protein QTP81_14865 [Alteromonas sp. ASW11-36]|uniref:DUF4194 domain-containing protein n=1 Tax=Alteromonas arenosi TaxID=3055817 RepID=A0ABT7T0B6_9ALTE|nr:hypothetical protein [Alteromonas sp. ASW11-36]MDM7861882.1 hypothetical protein [Alteromonas sp. ASW11-36]
MMNQQGRVLTQLLQGQFICQISDEEAWRYLKNSANRDALEPHLNLLNRTLTSTADGDVFFVGYTALGEDERKILGQQFQEVSSSLRPLVDWLLLVQQAQGSDVPVTMGTPIRLTELQTIIEDTPAFAEQLEKISRYRLFGSTSTQVDGQIKQVFKRLTDLGYLLKPNPEKQIFIATGKIDYLYEVLRFIDETESLSLAEQAQMASEQGSLL